jgi:hypothetical protein
LDHVAIVIRRHAHWQRSEAGRNPEECMSAQVANGPVDARNDRPGAVWLRSSRCEVNGSCVEVARLADGRIGIRDGKLGAASPVLAISPAQWRVLIARMGAGNFTIG